MKIYSKLLKNYKISETGFIVYFVIIILISTKISFAGLIRDAQTEQYLKNLAYPIAQSAGIDTNNLRIFIIADENINAFVAGGSNIFINTGLITKAETPDMVMAVLAHEIGHIYAGHLIKVGQNMQQANVKMILSYILGAAAAASGNGDIGTAIISGGSHIANRSFLSYTRANEQEADQMAIKFFDNLNISSNGILQMFELLRREEKKRLIGENIDSYARTHPLSKERIRHVRSHTEQNNTNNTLGKKIQTEHEQVKAKLIGFLAEPQQVISNFNPSNKTMQAKIARAVAKMRISLFNQSLSEIEELLINNDENAYLHELKGNILFEAKRYDEAIDSYRKALEIDTNSALIRSDYAKVIIAAKIPDWQNIAKKELLYAKSIDSTYKPTWRSLATIYGNEGDFGNAELCLAEIAALNHDKKQLLIHLQRAEKNIQSNDEEANLRLSDLRLFAKSLKDK